MSGGLDYRQAGVDIDEAERAVDLISSLVKSTRRPGVLSDIGGFAGFFRLDTERYPRPVLISGTDGVGTKLKVAQMTGIHDTVGIDLVAMCVNDILVSGAEPLFFLDYLAVGKLVPERVQEIVKGVVEGCRQANCALIGGETAEMPGFYREDEYDMAGFAVGVANEDRIITGAGAAVSDVIIGLKSSGLHSNGFSLARKILFDRTGYKPDQYLDALGKTVGEELLTPTRIYVRSILEVLRLVDVKAMAHITGGGIPGNLKRVLPAGLEARIASSAWTPPPVFELLAELGQVEREEMFRTFNMGIGFIMVVKPVEAETALSVLRRMGESPVVLGEILRGERGVVIE
ncbi:MAG: phosphoribosylformylglycinamidine cyclo-ligase [Syntrophomonadaceae bacterium]|nr:phosphoribosylformylglycinamidine cyclo-ligase [Syntrophomonadaceae bacterium]